MGDPRGFLEHARRTQPTRPPGERLGDSDEIYRPAPQAELAVQGARCMECGVPFCQSPAGCPLGNLIPEWNDLVFHGRWHQALERLHATNDFPEFTGRTCPAPCEGACVLGITDPPVAIKSIENAIVDRGFAEGWIEPRPPRRRTGRRVAVVGSGPAGLAAANRLNRAGHAVTVYERAPRPGGLLTYGIPAMKLGKEVVARRLGLMAAEGVRFVCGVEIGRDVTADELLGLADAVVLATGATRPRDLDVPGRDLDGIHFAVPYLAAATRRLLGEPADPDVEALELDARGRDVAVIGGGDTGTDCIATALRQGCRSLVNLEILPEPPAERPPGNPWPAWPRVLRTDYGHEEARHRFGRDPRRFATMTRRFLGDGAGRVAALETVECVWTEDEGGRSRPEPVPDSERTHPADLVLLALGFLGAEPRLPAALEVPLGEEGTVPAPPDTHATDRPGIFAAGDCRRGQSLVVWAIAEGRAAAAACDRWLAGEE